jgi:hypothetical protein
LDARIAEKVYGEPRVLTRLRALLPPSSNGNADPTKSTATCISPRDRAQLIFISGANETGTAASTDDGADVRFQLSGGFSMVTRQTRLSLIGAALLLVFSPACGDSDDDSGVNLSVDSSKSVTDLDQSEAEEICEAGAKLARRLLEPICVFSGVAAAAGGANCEAAKAECLSGLEGSLTDCSGASIPQGTTCDVTVGEIEACLNQVVAAIDNLIPDDLSCSSSPDDLANFQLPNVDDFTPASCETIIEKCDDLELGFNPEIG